MPTAGPDQGEGAGQTAQGRAVKGRNETTPQFIMPRERAKGRKQGCRDGEGEDLRSRADQKRNSKSGAQASDRKGGSPTIRKEFEEPLGVMDQVSLSPHSGRWNSDRRRRTRYRNNTGGESFSRTSWEVYMNGPAAPSMEYQKNRNLSTGKSDSRKAYQNRTKGRKRIRKVTHRNARTKGAPRDFFLSKQAWSDVAAR